MKYSHLLAFFILVAINIPVIGQRQSQISAGVDVGSGFTSGGWAPSVLYHEEISPNRLTWLRFGVGIRAWGYYDGRSNLYADTADPKDFLEYNNLSANGLSFVLGMNLRFWRIDLGVNTDLIGGSLGTRRSGFYDKLQATPDKLYQQWVSTVPVMFNMAPLVLKNYNGQSEAYARIFLTHDIGLKIGYVYGQIAYRTRNAANGNRVLLDDNQRRVYNTYGMPYAAVTFPLH